MPEIVDFIGSGVAFPLRVDSGGGIAMAGGSEDIERSLRSIISTAPGERVMRPEFGCAIWDYVFDPINDNTLGLMAQAVRDAVAQWEPRVQLEEVEVRAAADAGRVSIDLAYEIRTTNDRRNLVFPFYVIPEEPPL